MYFPNPDSKRTARKIARGVQVTSPNLSSRRHKRADKRQAIACTHANDVTTSNTVRLEVGGKHVRSYNGHEVSGGGSYKICV
jgi:hypothetical protein